VHLARGGTSIDHVARDARRAREPARRLERRLPRYRRSSAAGLVEGSGALVIASFGKSPNAGVTMQRPQSAAPLHTESRSTPRRRAASSTVDADRHRARAARSA
jgi:hypothetical protein